MEMATDDCLLIAFPSAAAPPGFVTEQTTVMQASWPKPAGGYLSTLPFQSFPVVTCCMAVDVHIPVTDLSN